MNTAFIVFLFGIAILTIIILLFLWWLERADARAQNNTVLFLQKKIAQMPNRLAAPQDVSIARRCIDLEKENATLRTDVETGCRIIDSQKVTINSLRALLEQSQQRNRATKHRK